MHPLENDAGHLLNVRECGVNERVKLRGNVNRALADMQPQLVGWQELLVADNGVLRASTCQHHAWGWPTIDKKPAAAGPEHMQPHEWPRAIRQEA
jgi:hypothetical protein